MGLNRENAGYIGRQASSEQCATGLRIAEATPQKPIHALGETIGAARTLANRVQRLRDRLIGAVPQAGSTADSAIASWGGILGEAKDISADVMREIRAATEALAQIEHALDAGDDISEPDKIAA